MKNGNFGEPPDEDRPDEEAGAKPPPGDDAAGEITELLRNGVSGNGERIIELLYQELKRIALRQHIDSENDSISATELVHEVYLRIFNGTVRRWRNSRHFARYSAQAMRRLLIERYRAHHTEKRGDGQRPLPLDSILERVRRLAGLGPEGLLDLDLALTKLAEVDASSARVVELRFFIGLSVPEIAAALNVHRSTVDRRWKFAKAWLHREMQ